MPKLPVAEVKRRLLRGLRATKEDYVYINVIHIIDVLGLEKAENLIEHLIETHEKTKVRGSRQLKSKHTGLAKFDRAALLLAIEEDDKVKAEQSGIQLQTGLLFSVNHPTPEVRDSRSKDLQ